MTYKLNHELLQKLRNGEIAIDNRGNPNYILLKQVLRDAFPRDIFEPNGNGLFYYAVNGSAEWIGTDTCDSISTIPLNDFIQKGVVVGYKVKPEYLEFVNAIHKKWNGTEIDPKLSYPMGDIWINSPAVEHYKKAGVLDLWFEPVYEEPKEEEPSVDEGIIKLYPRTTRIYNAQEKILRLMIDNKIPVEDMEAIGEKYSK